METYLFKFSACLAVFWLTYVLFLERQKMHRIKRFYLLGAFGISLIIPLLTFTHYIEPVVATHFETTQVFTPMAYSPLEVSQTPTVNPYWTLETILYFIYSLGVVLFAIRFIVNLVNMYRRITRNETIDKGDFIYVLLQEYRIPHSFFKYLFFNKTNYESNAIPMEVELHEKTHAKQLHSLDIIIIEVLQIVFWFHPLIYLLKHHIKLNHEFLADEAVLQHGIDTKNYQTLLLQFSSKPDGHTLSSAINYSSIKKRFTVMKTQTSKTRILVSGLLLLPILAILFYSFSTPEYVQKESAENLVTESAQNSISEGATNTMMADYKDWLSSYNRTKFINNSTYQRMVMIYDLMTDEQRGSVEKYPAIPSFDLSKIDPKSPSEHQFESWKEDKIFALWLDGNHIPNSTLRNYLASDIVYFTGSKVLNNAMSKKHPQPFQFNLYTKEGFQKTFKESKVNNYKSLFNKYNLAIHNYLNSLEIDYSELRLLKNQVDKLYNEFTQNEIRKHRIVVAPALPVQANPKTILNITIDENSNIVVNNTPSNFELLESYLKTITVPENYTINLKLENQSSTEMMEKTLLLLTKYDLLHVIKSSRIGNQQEKATPKDVADYNTWAKKIISAVAKAEASTNGEKSYPIIKLKDLNRYIEIYSRMSESQKKNSEVWPKLPPMLAPPPALPKEQSNSKGVLNFMDPQDLYNPDFLEYIIEMEEEGASFFLDDLKITAEKAKSIATDHTSNRTEMFTEKDENGIYVVKLYSSKKTKIYARSIELKILNDNSYVIDNIRATKSTFVDVFNQLHQDITPEQRNNYMNIHVTSSKAISNKETWFIYNSLQDYGFYRIVTPNQEIIRTKGNTPFAIESHFETQKQQENATPKQVSDYNKWAKQINNAITKAESSPSKVKEYPIIKLKDYNSYKVIYNLMSASQKKDSAPWPNFPATPLISEKPNKPIQNKKTIKPIEIEIDKNNKIVLNGKSVAFKDLAESVGDITQYLTIEEKRNYVTPSIIIDSEKNLDFFKKVSKELMKIDIWSNSIVYAENQKKLGLPAKHYHPTAGLTIEEAKTQQEQALKDYKENTKPDKTSPWAIEMGVNEVEVYETPEIKTGFIKINNLPHYFITIDGNTKYFDRYGFQISKDGNRISKNQVNASDLIPGQYITTIYSDDKVVASFKDNIPSHEKTTIDIPSPPMPISPLDHVIAMAKKGALFYFEGELISSDDAIALFKTNKTLNVTTKNSNVYITK